MFCNIDDNNGFLSLTLALVYTVVKRPSAKVNVTCNQVPTVSVELVQLCGMAKQSVKPVTPYI